MAQPQDHNDRDCKILSIVWYKVLPAKFGGQKAVAKFNEHLGSFAPLVCLCSKNNDNINTTYRVENSLPVSKAQFINPFVWWKIYRCIKKHSITHLVLEFPYHGISTMLCRKLLRVKCILNTHNIEHLRFKALGKRWWKLLFFYERWVMRKFDLVFFKTKSDREYAVRILKLPESKTAIIPYGADEQPLSSANAKLIVQERHGINRQEKILLFAGTLDYGPNAQAVLDIKEKLLPLLAQLDFAFKIIICGRNHLHAFDYLKRISHPAIVFAGEVDDIETYFRAADVFINPVTIGGGVQTKIIDALSYHLNVVAFASKAGVVVEAGHKLRSVPDTNWSAFASAVHASTIAGGKIPEAFFDTYNWRSIAAKAFQKICSV